MNGKRAAILAALLALANAPAFSGTGKVVGGAVARTIACMNILAYHLALEKSLQRLPGKPPLRPAAPVLVSARIRRPLPVGTRQPAMSA